MRFRFQPWQLAVLLALICVGVTVGIYTYRTHAGLNPADLVSYLPAENATVVYIDVDAIRRSGILNMIAGTKAAEELEYQEFVDQTLFDYRQDLDAVAAVFKEHDVFLTLRGRFHWKNLMDYAVRQGGSCHNSVCTVPGSRPSRHVSFYPLRPNLMAMAISSDDFAAYVITRKRHKSALTPPEQPLWMSVPAQTLQDAESLPAGAKPYVSALHNAEQILFTVGPDADHLQLSLQVTCRDAGSASTLLAQFENTTATLRKWIAREHQQANPADLSGVLVAGTFRRDDRHVYAQWPISRAFVDSLMAEPY